MTDFTTSPDGTRIAYDRYGDGPALVLVGGAFQHRAIDSSTAELAQSLASGGLSVLHYDRRGRGDSSETLPWAREREIEDIAALIDAAGGRASLYGMSSGGIVALDAVAAGLPVGRVAVYEMPANFEQPGEDISAQLRAHCDAGDPGAAAAQFLRLSGLPEQALDGMRASPMWPAFCSVAPTLAYDTTFTANASLDRWAAIAIPALVGVGGDSEPWWHATADAAARAIPDARRFTLDGQTHQVATESLAPVLSEFFS